MAVGGGTSDAKIGFMILTVVGLIAAIRNGLLQLSLFGKFCIFIYLCLPTNFFVGLNLWNGCCIF